MNARSTQGAAQPGDRMDSSGAAQQGRSPSNTTPLASLCREAITQLNCALDLPPAELGEQVDIVEQAVVRLRNGLIERLHSESFRQEAPSGAIEENKLRAALNHTNSALSLIVGVEYPASGYHRKLLQQATDALRQVDTGAIGDAR